ncbi:dockerin type I domain-containing protein [Ruminococcus flavefaciens]|uniref:Dockerin domain-containing protein n=1 Tax=Ruminococcus flavefaciens 007c TaxID=1341157 RepID=W7UEK9_RUMFL|nr:dockerin type I domain-containing protein [Ruminococcus flavefaciens]EWM52383.1 hypothetical protein RF007C_13615 [Ruminococcus flavefaciens 007c]
MREIKIVKRLAATLISFCMMIPSFTFTSVNAVSTTTTTTTTTKRTTPTTTTTRKVTSTTPLSSPVTTTSQSSVFRLGDVNADGNVDSIDSSFVLIEYSKLSSGNGIGSFNDEQRRAADVDKNGITNAVDASKILWYYAYSSTHENAVSLDDFLKDRYRNTSSTKIIAVNTESAYDEYDDNILNKLDVTLLLTQKKLTLYEARSNPSIEIILSAKSSNGATINSTGIHIIYDDRLQIVPDEYDNVADCMNSRLRSFKAQKYEANGIFVATSSDRECMLSADGTNLWRFTLRLPSNVKVGDIYPINIVYMDGDLFDNCLSNDTEKLRENAFSHIEQGYIEIIDSPQTTTSKATTTTTKRVTTTSTTTFTTTTTMVSTTNKLDALKNTSYILTNGDQYTIPIDPSDLIFRSNNSDVAVVSKTGTITAIGNGDAIISIIDTESNVVQIKITVNPIGYTTSSTITQPGITTTTTTTSQHSDYNLGDVNNDGMVNAVDASSVLAYYAMISTNKDGGYTEEQQLAADVDHDGKINAVDASNILSYYAYISTTKEAVVSMEEYTNSNKWEKAYQDKLQEFMNSDAFGTIAPNDSMFDLRDINGDNIPELFISVGTYHAATVQVFSFLNGEIIELFDGGEYGLLSYIPSESYLCENVSKAPGPDKSIDSLLKVYKYDGKTITKVIEFGDNFRGMNNYFTIDGTEVDKNKYYNEKEKYNLQSSISLGRNYLFDSVNINNIKSY